MNARRLFSLGSLILQDPMVGRATYADTEPLWAALHQIYATYLDFPPNDIVARATGELLTKLSEVVGIGCGLAAMSSQFAININRFRRFTPPGTGRRVDFEFYSRAQRFFHETKGTTHAKRVVGLRRDILAQKTATKQHCRRRGNGPRLAACTASVSLYQHTSRMGFNSTILLLDPPAGDDGGREAREADELSSLLRYYRNFYIVTHLNPQNVELIGLADWLGDVIRILDDGGSPPRQAPLGLVARGRIHEPGAPDSPFAGTIFDARIADRTVTNYRTFQEATAAIKQPLTFLGVSDIVTRIIASCSWDKLLNYADPDVTAESDQTDTRDVLESGVVTISLPADEELEASSRSQFAILRRRAEQQGRSRP